MRPGVEALATFCRGRGWHFAVVSHGLSFYIEALLPSWIPFTSFVGTFNEWSWRVALPATMALSPGEDFKSRVVADLRARHPGHQVAYIGDGRLDLAAALTCDRIFAVAGSRLADLGARRRPHRRGVRAAGRGRRLLVVAQSGVTMRRMANPTATFSTSLGDIQVELFTDKMPITAGNFVKLAKSGFYDGLHFHRVIDKLHDPVRLPAQQGSEQPARRHRRQPARHASRTSTRRTPRSRTSRARCRWRTPAPNSGSCQFFINTVHNAYLDWFTPGRVEAPGVRQGDRRAWTSSTKISKAPRGPGDRPKTPIKMNKITVSDG